MCSIVRLYVPTAAYFMVSDLRLIGEITTERMNNE